MPGSTILYCLFGVIALLVIVFVASALKVVPEYQRLVVFRLGRCIGARGPGLIILIPFVDRAVRVDLREQVREIPAQTSITLDNAPISIDFLWYYKVFDPVQSVLQVGNFEMAAQGIATTTLRSVIGGILLDDVLSQREKINQSLRARLDEVTERWGVKVTNVEIREIIPPREVQELDEPPADCRAHPPRRGDRIDRYARGRHQCGRRRAPGFHSASRRRKTIGHLAGRRRAPVAAAAGRGLLERSRAHQQDRADGRPQDHDFSSTSRLSAICPTARLRSSSSPSS